MRDCEVGLRLAGVWELGLNDDDYGVVGLRSIMGLGLLGAAQDI